MELNDQSIKYLLETARWATILSIIGFIVIGLLIVVSFSVGSFLANSPYSEMGISPQVLSITYLIIAGVYFIPIFFLYQFGIKTKHAIDNNADQTVLKLILDRLNLDKLKLYGMSVPEYVEYLKEDDNDELANLINSYIR